MQTVFSNYYVDYFKTYLHFAEWHSFVFWEGTYQSIVALGVALTGPQGRIQVQISWHSLMSDTWSHNTSFPFIKKYIVCVWFLFVFYAWKKVFNMC